MLGLRKEKTKTGCLWTLAYDDRRWGCDDPPGFVFHYAGCRIGRHAEVLLTGLNSILQVDGYVGYNRLTRSSRKGGDPAIVAQCWAHARRKLPEVYDRDGSEIAAEGLPQIADPYAARAGIKGMSAYNRLAARTTRSALFDCRLRCMANRKTRSHLQEIPPRRKLAYITNHWSGLQAFLTDGRIEMDSNPVENMIRPIALNCKNTLFADHDEGGKARALSSH